MSPEVASNEKMPASLPDKITYLTSCTPSGSMAFTVRITLKEGEIGYGTSSAYIDPVNSGHSSSTFRTFTITTALELMLGVPMSVVIIIA